MTALPMMNSLTTLNLPTTFERKQYHVPSALDLVIRQERLVRGEPSDHTAVTIEDAIKREYERWMVPPVAEEETESGTEGDDDLDDLQGIDFDKE